MKQEWLNYLAAIGAEEPVIEQIRAAEAVIAPLSPQPFEDFFVGDVLSADGTHTFGSAWFFTADLLIEVKQFVAQGSDDFDFARIQTSAVWIRVTKSSYDFDTPTDASRLTVLAVGTDWSNKFQASKSNCSHLKRILQERLLPANRG